MELDGAVGRGGVDAAPGCQSDLLRLVGLHMYCVTIGFAMRRHHLDALSERRALLALQRYTLYLGNVPPDDEQQHFRQDGEIQRYRARPHVS